MTRPRADRGTARTDRHGDRGLSGEEVHGTLIIEVVLCQDKHENKVQEFIKEDTKKDALNFASLHSDNKASYSGAITIAYFVNLDSIY